MIPTRAVYADHLDFIVVKCDPLAPGMSASKCRDDYLAGLLNDQIIEEGGSFWYNEPLMVAPRINVLPSTTLSNIRIYFTWDYQQTGTINPITTGNYGLPMSAFAVPMIGSSSNSGAYNKPGEPPQITMHTGYGNYTPPVAAFSHSGEMAYFFFQGVDPLSPTIEPNTTFSFQFLDEKTDATDNYHNPVTINSIPFNIVFAPPKNEARLETVDFDIHSSYMSISPAFDKDIYEYNVVVGSAVNNINITATTVSDDATIAPEALGEKTLNVGTNIFQIPVTAFDGTVKTYQFEFYKPSTDATLSSLSASGIDIGTFSPTTYNYSANVPYSTTSTVITAVASDPNATVMSPEYVWNLGVATNYKNIEVQSESCKEPYQSLNGGIECAKQTYWLQITRTHPSTNNFLTDIYINGIRIWTFWKYTYSYNDLDPVVNQVDQIEITADLDDPSAEIVSGLGTYPLAVGDNYFEVVVKSESGSLRTYDFVLKRLSDDTMLQELSLSTEPSSPLSGPLTPEFSKLYSDEYTYYYEPTANNINISAKVNDIDKAKVCIAVVPEVGNVSCTGILNEATASYALNSAPNATSKIAIISTSEQGSRKYTYVNLIRRTSTDSTLSSLSLSEGTLSPVFEPTNLNYTADVPEHINSISVDAMTNCPKANVTITGNDNLTVGINQITVTVVAENGSFTEYIINVNKAASSIGTLSSLVVKNGANIFSVEPTFVPDDETQLTYSTTIPGNVYSVVLEATPTKDSATIQEGALGEKNLNLGDNNFNIPVVAENGEIVVYTVNAIKLANTDTSLLSLTPSAGTLNYTNDITDYELKVAEEVEMISFEAVLTDANATITGTGTTQLSIGSNFVSITILAEDNITERIITINVIREKELVDILIPITEILMVRGTTKQLTYTLDPIDTTMTEVVWSGGLEPVWSGGFNQIATVSSTGLVSAVDPGSTTITISSKDNPSISKNIALTVISEELMSTHSFHIINKYHQTPYVIGIEPGVTRAEILNYFENYYDQVKLYNRNDELITDDNTLVGSFMKLKLELDGVIHDELTVLIRGDMNGDGLITMMDYTLIRNYVLNQIEHNTTLDLIADTSRDDYVTVSDITLIKNKIADPTLTFNFVGSWDLEIEFP